MIERSTKYYPQVNGANQCGSRLFVRGCEPNTVLIHAFDQFSIQGVNYKNPVTDRDAECRFILTCASDVLADADGNAVIELSTPMEMSKLSTLPANGALIL